MNYKLVYKYHIFIFIIFFTQADKTISEFSLKYPFSLYLPNGNIFVVHETGIAIYDHLFSTQVEEVKVFPKKRN